MYLEETMKTVMNVDIAALYLTAHLKKTEVEKVD